MCVNVLPTCVYVVAYVCLEPVEFERAELPRTAVLDGL